MKKWLAALIAGVVLGLPLAALAGPDESQKVLVQRMMDAKKKLAAAQAASGPERQKAMQEHMKLMHEMMGHMTDEHHMMMQGMGKK